MDHERDEEARYYALELREYSQTSYLTQTAH